jgi:transcriptional regulator with XRE-family HTH domain
MSEQGDYSHDPLVRAFAALLRAHREAAGLSLTKLAEALGCSPQWIGMLEAMRKPPSEATAIDCDTYFKTTPSFHTLWKQYKDRPKYVALPPWFQHWLEIEQTADVLRNWEPLIIPGLLQTPEYARALFTDKPGITDEELEQYVTSRAERQTVLTKENPVLYRVLVDEGVLHRLIGSPHIMRDQLAALIEMAQLRNVVVQVVPSGTLCTAGVNGAFWIAGVTGRTDTVYLEGATEGRVSDHPREVAEVQLRYDALNAAALSPEPSIELIRKVMEEKWPQT